MYGWFSALMCAGSVFGAFAWGFWMRALTAEFAATGDEIDGNALYLSFEAQSQNARSIFYVLYAMSFLCLSVSKLLVHQPFLIYYCFAVCKYPPKVLERMAGFAIPEEHILRRRLNVWRLAVLAAVVLGNATGLFGNIAAAAVGKQSGDIFSAAETAYAANNSEVGHTLSHLGREKHE